MKILWLDINSSYSHSSVALPAIHAQVLDRAGWEWEVVRGTINDNPGALAASVARCNPDVIASTFWLFTHRMQTEVLSRVGQLCPGVKVICGGPEFLGDNEDFLRRNPFVSAVIRGEGELACPALLDCIYDHSRWKDVEGLCWISPEDGLYHDNGIARVYDFAALRYPEESSFFLWDKPFVQLETTRGCFNACAFCVSGGEKPVRYQSMDQVRDRLENICSHGIKDVRVLDRTFNYDTSRACRMLSLFNEYAGRMRFHLEIHPSLLSERLRQEIALLPEGLLHLEAGIQSLDAGVLSESGRRGSLESSLDGLRFLCSLDNVETHADLIAGLPSYSLDMLCSDIVRLIEAGVDELQVESLKVLPGTVLRRTSCELGLCFSPLPPYEILKTPSISPDELEVAMQISRMIDLYYNSSAWQNVTRSLVLSSPAFVRKFTSYLAEKMVLDSPVSLERRGALLYEYCSQFYPQMLPDISIAWIEAGFSLKKEPAGKIVRLKHIDAFIEENGSKFIVKYGRTDPSYRYYHMKSGAKNVLFGYSSEVHSPAPVFMAFL